MSETSPESGRDPVEQLLESFLARWRRGERPSPEEYAARCPERADEIRELFPALVEMEQLKPGVEAATGGLEPPSPRPEPAAQSAPPHPERLGDYHILRVIGEGGMGTVYEAEHESLKNRVALKVMHPRFRADRNYLRRFQTEARAAARLHHTNIVSVFDFGVQNGICYYAMQYIAGVGLNDVLEDVRRLRAAAEAASRAGTGGMAGDQPTEPVDGPLSAVARGLLTGRFVTTPATPAGSGQPPTASLAHERADPTALVDAPHPPAPAPSIAPPPDRGSGSHSFAGQPEPTYFREIARLGAQVADALDYAHHQKIVHRDIKPSNLLLDAQGNAWVTDFGLAKFVEGDDLSGSHDLAGTLRFMAPERFRGDNDRRSDIYALGATLYELLALRPAFAERDQVLLIDQIAHQPPTPLRQHDRRIPRDLETIVHKVLSKDPKDRCNQAGELRDELRRFLEGRPTRWRRVGPVEQLRRWSKRNPGMAALTASVCTLVVAVAIISTAAAVWLGQSRADVLANLKRATTAEAERTDQLWQSYRVQARAGRFSRQAGQRFDNLEALAKAARIRTSTELRNEAIACLALVDLKLERWVEFPTDCPNADIDPQFERYAVCAPRGDVLIRGAADDRELLRLPGFGDAAVYLGFSPDRRHLMVQYSGPNRGRELRLWDLGRGDRVTSVPLGQTGGGFNFSPDGHRATAELLDGSIGLFDVATGRLERTIKGIPHSGIWVLHPDGRRLAIPSQAERSVRIVDVERGEVVGTYPTEAGTQAIAWRGDGRLLAAGGADHRIYLWDNEHKRLLSVLDGHQGLVTYLAFTHAGDLLVSIAWDGSTRVWEPVRGKLLVTTLGAGNNLRISADDRRVAHDTFGNGLTVFRLDTGRECRVLHHGLVGNRTPRPRPGPESLDYSLNGRLLASASFDGVQIWDPASGTAVAHLPLGYTTCARFRPDGSALATFGVAGLHLWPIRSDLDATDGGLQLGPPQGLGLPRYPIPDQGTRVDWDRTGRLLAANDVRSARAVVIDLDTRTEVARFGAHSNLRDVTLSPDGRWVATSTWMGRNVKVWDVAGKNVAWEWPCTHALVAFSPDGRWLAVSDQQRKEYRLWHVGSWRLGAVISVDESGYMAFSPDGTLLALATARGVRLVDPDTGQEIATLTPPPESSQRTDWMCFSPDGGQLAVSTGDHTILLWDLRLIRRELAAMGLDWNAPAFPDASTVAPSGPLKLAVNLGSLASEIERPETIVERQTARLNDHPDEADAYHQRGQALFRLKRHEEAVADFTAALRLRPDDAPLHAARGAVFEALRRYEAAIADFERALRLQPDQAVVRPHLALCSNNLAWELTAGPPAHRAPTRAVALARRAVELTPDQALYLNTLGVALHRVGLFAEAVATLERSLAAGKGQSDAFDLFFLAMARFKLGEIDRACVDFDRAVKWRRDHPNQPAQYSTELDAFQAEAESLLDGPPRELPADVFAPEPVVRDSSG
jgi:serine/threonine protein kinase/WD40 repeat protein/tetratricopeptide (TPR) repeat protein